MMRWDIINHLIKENGYKTYLEIGYYKGWSFDRIECDSKTAVDPNPCKTPEQEAYSTGRWICDKSVPTERDNIFQCIHTIHKKKSDEFFEELGSLPKYDIIFIDGLHESTQVDRDIQNALKHLSPGGNIVMHDCNPSSYEMTTTGTVHGEWTGDVYKSFCKLKIQDKMECYVVDTDYGVGIIRGEYQDLGVWEAISPSWDYFNKHRKSLLNLISTEEFLKRETNVKTTTDNLS